LSGFIDDTYELEIGEVDPDFVDSQEQVLPGLNSSPEELSEDEFYEGQYADPEMRLLEELIQPSEMLFNHNNAFKPQHQRQARSASARNRRPSDRTDSGGGGVGGGVDNGAASNIKGRSPVR